MRLNWRRWKRADDRERGAEFGRKGKSRNQCPNKDKGPRNKEREKKERKKEPDKESENFNSVDRMSRS